MVRSVLATHALASSTADALDADKEKKKKEAYTIFSFMFVFGLHPFLLLLLHCPPTLSVLWSIRLSVHSQK